MAKNGKCRLEKGLNGLNLHFFEKKKLTKMGKNGQKMGKMGKND